MPRERSPHPRLFLVHVEPRGSTEPCGPRANHKHVDVYQGHLHICIRHMARPLCFHTTSRVKMPEKWRPAERTRERAVSTWLARCDLAVPAYHSFRERACLCPEQDRHQYSWASSFMFDLRSRPIIINKEHTKKVQGPVSSHPVQSFVPGAGKHEHVREDAGNLDDPSRNVPRQRIDCKKLPSQR